jgi:hypothetical protein
LDATELKPERMWKDWSWLDLILATALRMEENKKWHSR